MFAEAGSDLPPWSGSVIRVALSVGAGQYRDVSALIPPEQQILRSYSLAAGDLDGDGRVELILPDQSTESGGGGSGGNTALLRWNGNGFDAKRDWIPRSLWRAPTDLWVQSWMNVADFDNDGRQDLLVSGHQRTPNLRILFGSPRTYTAADVVTVPDGMFGHGTPSPSAVKDAADVEPVVVADFNNDGLLDIFATEERVRTFPPGTITDTNEPGYEGIRANGGAQPIDIGIQVLINQGARRFADVTASSSVQNLGRRHYNDLQAFDMNNDGYLDIVGRYVTRLYAGVPRQHGTTVFLNDGTGAFQVVEGSRLLAAVTTTAAREGQQWDLGMFVPTMVAPQRTEGIVVAPVGGCQGGPGVCSPSTGVNVYKIVANSAIGTGPDFVNSASLGAPGFNEFYYLRHHPDAATAVQQGKYRSGLDHYLAEGMGRGYQPHARTRRPLQR